MPNPTIPITGPAVPVVATNQAQLNRKMVAQALTALGMVVVTLQQSQPALVSLFPHTKWIGGAITALGMLWQTVEKFKDAANLTVANYSIPATSTAVQPATPPAP